MDSVELIQIRKLHKETDIIVKRETDLLYNFFFFWFCTVNIDDVKENSLYLIADDVKYMFSCEVQSNDWMNLRKPIRKRVSSF